jgi:hypothetical protein
MFGVVFLMEGMGLAQVNGQEALRQLNSMELRSQSLDDLLPIRMRR